MAVDSQGSPHFFRPLPHPGDAESSGFQFSTRAGEIKSAPVIAHTQAHLPRFKGQNQGDLVCLSVCHGVRDGFLTDPQQAMLDTARQSVGDAFQNKAAIERCAHFLSEQASERLVQRGRLQGRGAQSRDRAPCLGETLAGQVTRLADPRVYLPQLNLVGGIAPELMVRVLDEGPEGSASLTSLGRLDRLRKGITVLAIGPGLSTLGEASEFARELIAKTELPVVIDADALNAFDVEKAKALTGAGRVMVLTPHPGEMARLLGVTVQQVEANRVAIARSFATGHQVTLVLKGWRTLVAHPDGRVAVNTTGNPALAKGGSGDILTGIVAAMLAQHPDEVAAAVEAAVYLHGLAADLCAQEMDEKTVLATDVIRHLSAAFRYRVQDEDELTWLCGVCKPQGAGQA